VFLACFIVAFRGHDLCVGRRFFSCELGLIFFFETKTGFRRVVMAMALSAAEGAIVRFAPALVRAAAGLEPGAADALRAAHAGGAALGGFDPASGLSLLQVALISGGGGGGGGCWQPARKRVCAAA
jgi:hypothetical protein